MPAATHTMTAAGIKLTRAEARVGDLDPQLLYQEYFARIHRAAVVLCGNPWDADDLAQETFLLISAKKAKFRGESQVYTWLYGILLNLERQRRRQRDRRQNRLKIFRENQDPAPTGAPAASAALESKEWKQSLWSHVAELPDGQRQTLVLRFSEQLRYEEIAEVLGCPLGTVKSRIYHGLAALRARISQSGEDLNVPGFPNEDESPPESRNHVS